MAKLHHRLAGQASIGNWKW